MSIEELYVEVQHIAESQARLEERVKSAFNRINEQQALVESVHKLATSVELLASAQKATEKKVDTLTHDVEVIKDKPAKRWDLIITSIVTALVAFLLGKFGIS